MTNVTNELFNELDNLDTTDLADFTDIKQGGGDFAPRILPKGYALVRPVEYIEYGVHKQPDFQGKPKDPCAEFILGFAIVGGQGINTDGVKEKYVSDEDATAKKFPIVRTFPTALKFFDKAAAVKIHKALNNMGKQSTHIVQKLPESPLYLLKVEHETPTKGKSAGKLRHKLCFTELQPALDAVTADPIEAPKVEPSMIKAFLWDKPSIGQWDSIFVEGVWEAREAKPAEGDKPAQAARPAISKNKDQEKIMSALNFEGSPIAQLLAKAGRDVPAPTKMPSLEATDTPAIEPTPDLPTTPAVTAPTGDLD